MHDPLPQPVSVGASPTAAEFQAFLHQSTEGLCLIRFSPAIDLAAVNDDTALADAISAGIVVECNDGFARMYGRHEAKDLIGQPVDAVVRFTDPANAGWLKTLRDRGFVVRDVRTQQTDAARHERFFSIDFLGTITAGQLENLWWTQRDVTADTTAVRDSQHLRDEISRTLAGFLAMVTHELRKPLTPALLLVSYLESRGDLSEELREDAQLIRQSIEAQSGLIDELADVSSLSAGKMKLELALQDLHELLHSLLKSIDSREAERTLLDLRASDPVVLIESTRFRQALLAVLGSAWRCSDRKSSTRVLTRNVGTSLEIAVSHEGTGYEPSRLSRMFDAFDTTGRTRGMQGLGLDLVRARGFIHAMGGRLVVTSDGAECGATFTFIFPLAKCDPRSKELLCDQP